MIDQNPKILIYQPRQLGDVLLCTPLLRAIKQALPNSEIHFLTSDIGESLLLKNPYITKLHVILRRSSLLNKVNLFRKLRKVKFDAIFDLMSTPKTTLQLFCLRAHYRLTTRCRFYGLFSTDVIDGSKNQFHYSALSKILFLEKFLERIQRNDLIKKSLLDYSQKLDLFVTQDEILFAQKFCETHRISQETSIAFNVVSRRKYKIWDAKNFAQVIQFLLDKQMRIFFLYGPNEFHMVSDVLKELPEFYRKHKNMIYQYELMTIRQLFCVLMNCKLYFGNDSGLKHIACAAGISTVTVFNSDQSRNWTPVDDERHIVFDGKASVHEIIGQLLNLV